MKIFGAKQTTYVLCPRPTGTVGKLKTSAAISLGGRIDSRVY